LKKGRNKNEIVEQVKEIIYLEGSNKRRRMDRRRKRKKNKETKEEKYTVASRPVAK
jgi:hypothetical protein